MAAPAQTFQPRTALVTGAAQGIGRAIALRLADDGLDVAVNDIAAKADPLAELVAAIRAKGRRAVAVVADVSREAEVQEMVAQAVQAFDGVLDVVSISVASCCITAFAEHGSRWSRMQGLRSWHPSQIVRISPLTVQHIQACSG